jgi:adenine deaminase
VARDGQVTGELALPIAGLLSEAPAEQVVETLDGLEAQLRDCGVTVATPFMALSFLALSVIPALKLTDQGLVDVNAFALVGVGAD